MNYEIEVSAISNQDAVIHIKQSEIDFGTTAQTAETLPNPAELFLGALAACLLKSLERFSTIMKFTYSKAILEVHGTRLENRPRLDNITYQLTIYSHDTKLNTALLQRNIEKFGTIYNTVKVSCAISGAIAVSHV